jgi:hypothetical protein
MHLNVILYLGVSNILKTCIRFPEMSNVDSITECLVHIAKLKLKLIYDRQSVGQSVLVSGAHLGPMTFFFLLGISFRQLRLCYFVAPSLTRGQVCNLLVQLFLGLARAVTIGSKYLKTLGHILLFHLRLPQPGGPGSRIYIPRNRVAQLVS